MVSTTIFSVQPATQTWHVNDVFTVTVSLSDVTNLGAFDFYLSYNGTIVTPTSITLLSPISSTGRTPIIVANEIDGTGQYVHLAVATLGLTTTQGVSGNVVALFPNGITYYYFSDNREFTWDAALRESDKIIPLCEQ